MTLLNNDLVQEIRLEIAQLLGVPPEKLPIDLSPQDACLILGIKPRTAAIWRSTGRYNLPYYKAGRLVRYRINDLIKFKARRMCQHTGNTGHQNTGEQ
jgi:Helix-turn-helix domain